jgi:hypothetical protein
MSIACAQIYVVIQKLMYSMRAHDAFVAQQRFFACG